MILLIGFERRSGEERPRTNLWTRAQGICQLQSQAIGQAPHGGREAVVVRCSLQHRDQEMPVLRILGVGPDGVPAAQAEHAAGECHRKPGTDGQLPGPSPIHRSCIGESCHAEGGSELTGGHGRHAARHIQGLHHQLTHRPSQLRLVRRSVEVCHHHPGGWQ
jgi:hypothetical protein